MRPGHKASGGEQARFEADAEGLPVLEPVEEGELVDEHGTEGEAAGGLQAADGDLGVTAEDRLEVLVEVLNRQRAELVEDAADLHAGVVVRIGAVSGGN